MATVETIKAVYALWERAGTPGERAAAAAAYERMTGEPIEPANAAHVHSFGIDLNAAISDADAEAAVARQEAAQRAEASRQQRAERVRREAIARARAVRLADLERQDAAEVAGRHAQAALWAQRVAALTERGRAARTS